MVARRRSRPARRRSRDARSGGSTPGTSEDQLAARMNRKSVPISARNRAGSWPTAARIWSSSAAITSSSTDWPRPARSRRPRVSRIEPSASTAMMPQVVTTGWVTGTGPREKAICASSGLSIIAAPRGARGRGRAARPRRRRSAPLAPASAQSQRNAPRATSRAICRPTAERRPASMRSATVARERKCRSPAPKPAARARSACRASGQASRLIARASSAAPARGRAPRRARSARRPG